VTGVSGETHSTPLCMASLAFIGILLSMSIQTKRD